MKKILIFIFILNSFLFANAIKKDTFFVKLNSGMLKVHESDSIIGLAAGYYFYDPNIYKINNRIYIDFKKVNTDADFYITSLKLDWIKNTSSVIAPFLGVNIGYLYFNDNGVDYSTNIWGGELGVIIEITYNFNINIEVCYQKAIEKQDIWNTPLKTFKGGIEFDF